jgi:flagellar assembly protein FliH
MSAKVIKHSEKKAFPVFSLDGQERQQTSAYMPVPQDVYQQLPTHTAHHVQPDNSHNLTHNLIEEVNEEAKRIIAEATMRANQIENEARDRGIAEARSRMALEVNKAVEPLRERLTQTLDELASLRSSLMARTERDLVRLALEIAKKVVHREVTIDHEIALTLARVSLGRIHNRAAATIHLHPEDYTYVSAHREQLSSISAIEIIEDRSIGRGGCLIQTEMGDVDARIEQQFAEIERGLMNP